MQQAAISEQVAAAIHAWADNGDREQLDAGPTPADLGGPAAAAEAAPALAASPWFAYLIDVAGKLDPTAAPEPTDLLARIDAAIVAGFATHERPSSYASATARLLRYPTLAGRLDRALEHALLARAEHATDPAASARAVAVGGSALETLVHLVTTGVCKPHRLLAYCGDLVEKVNVAPVEFSRRLPHLVGIVHEHFADNDLISLLQRLRDTPTGQQRRI